MTTSASALPAPASGARSGALIAGATAASILAAYVFLLAAGRLLGSEDYGSLAALLGLLNILVSPAGALQMAVSREVSRSLATGDKRGAARLARGTLRVFAVATVPIVLVAAALAPVLSGLLHIHSTPIVLLAVLSLSTALVFPVALGILQGEQRFPALSSLYVIPWGVRVVVLGIAAAAGFRLGGAVFATLLGALVSMGIAYALVRGTIRGAEQLSPAELRTFLVYLWPVAVALIGIAALTNIDLLIVKARFSGDAAGDYAAASAFARVGFFVPTAILAVLFPRTAARQARGEETADILGRSLVATTAFCGLLALVYAAAGTGLVTTTYGSDFSEGGHILAPFALAMGCFALANVLVGYHLSRGETRYAWIVASAVVVQVIALATIPSSLEGVVWTNVVVGTILLAAHEVFVGSSVPALRAAARRIPARTWSRVRAAALETAVVLAGCTAVVCVLFWHVVLHLGSTIIGSPGSDSTGSVSFLWTQQHESGFHILGTAHHTLTAAPFGWDEGNGLNIQWFLPYYPAYLLTKLFNAVAAYNLITFAGYILTAASMYLLIRYLRCSRLVAAWGALVMILFPWHLARAEHASRPHVEVLVLLLFALIAAARQPTLLRFALVGLATLACWLTSGYFGGMAVITAIGFATAAALTGARRRGWLLLGGATGAALVASGLVAIAAYVSGSNRTAGIEREASDLSILGLRPLELVVPSQRHLVGSFDAFWSHHQHQSNVTETSNYLGWLTIALALAWLVIVWRRRRRDQVELSTAAGLGGAFAIGFLFALPSPVAGIPMPSKLLWHVLPAFRVPSRWDPLLMAALVPLAALGLQWVVRRFGTRPLAAAGVVAAAMALSFIELTTHPVGHFRTVPVPPEYTALEQKAPPGILAEYPLGYSDIYRLWQRVHGRPLMNGAPLGSTADFARYAVIDPSDPGAAPDLSLLGVSAILIHPGGPADVPVQPREPATAEGYRLLGRFAQNVTLWDVTAQPAPALALLPSGFAAPQLVGNRVVNALIDASGVGVLELRAKHGGLVRLDFDATAPKGSSDLRLVDATHEQPFTISGTTHVSTLVQVPQGVSQLLVKVDPAATSLDDAVQLTTPRTTRATGEAQLRPAAVSRDPGF